MSRARPDTLPRRNLGLGRCGVAVCLAIWGISGCSGATSPVLSVGWGSRASQTALDQHLETAATETPAESSGLEVQLTTNAREAGWKPELPLRPWDRVVLHHTATSTGSVASIDSVHKRKTDGRGQPWLGIGYHFVIGNGQGMADGAIEPTFRWRQQLPGAHAGDAEINQTGVGIALVGNFDKSPPTPAQREAVTRLIRHLLETLELTPERVIGHGDIKATACPGRYFSLDALRTSVAALDDSGGPPLARFVPATGIPRKEALRK